MTVEALGLGAIEILVIWHICGGVIVDNVGYHADVPAADTSTPTLAKPLKIHEEPIKKKPKLQGCVILPDDCLTTCDCLTIYILYLL